MRYVSSFVVVAELLQVGRRQGRFDGIFLLGIAHRRRHSMMDSLSDSLSDESMTDSLAGVSDPLSDSLSAEREVTASVPAIDPKVIHRRSETVMDWYGGSVRPP